MLVAGLDIAMTWVILAAVPAAVELLASFLVEADRREAEVWLDEACSLRLDDPNIGEEERAAVRALRHHHGSRRITP